MYFSRVPGDVDSEDHGLRGCNGRLPAPWQFCLLAEVSTVLCCGLVPPPPQREVLLLLSRIAPVGERMWKPDFPAPHLIYTGWLQEGTGTRATNEKLK